jgi:hypothetical protein
MNRNDSRKAWRAVPLLALGALTAGAAGCFHSHTIESGTWRLTIEAKESSEGRQFVRKPRDVQVTVDWSSTDKDIEAVKVTFESREDQRPVTRVLTGQIKDGEVSLGGADRDWEILLRGKVYDRESMNGTSFARLRWNEQTYFSGTWTMVKVKPGEG